MHDEPEYDAYYNTYIEVQSFAGNANAIVTPIKHTNNASVAQMLNNPNKIMSPLLYQQPPKQYQHQYTKSSPVLLSPTATTKQHTTISALPTTHFASQSSFADKHDQECVADDDIPPPLPPPNRNSPHSNSNQQHYHHQHQLSLPLRYQQQLTTTQSTPTPPPSSTMTDHHSNTNNNHTSQQHFHQQQQYQELPMPDYNHGEAIYGKNSPTVSSIISIASDVDVINTRIIIGL